MFKAISMIISDRIEQIKEKIVARKQELAIAKIYSLKDKGELIGEQPEGVGHSLFTKGCHTYVKCIFVTVGGRIFHTDRITPGNRFQTKLSNGKTAIWSIMTKEIECWKWDTCHRVKGIFVGYVE